MKKKVNYFSNSFGCIINDNVIICRKGIFLKVEAIQSVEIIEISLKVQKKISISICMYFFIVYTLNLLTPNFVDLILLSVQFFFILHYLFSRSLKCKIVLKDNTTKVIKVKSKLNQEAKRFCNQLEVVLLNQT